MTQWRWIIAGLIVGILAAWWAIDVRNRSNFRPEKPQIHRTDLTVYTTAGAAFLDNDPATDPYDSPNPRGWVYLYPPLFALAMAPLDALHPHVASGIWFAINVALAFSIFFLLKRLIRVLWPSERPAEFKGRWPRVVPGYVAVFTISAMILPMLNGMQRGQVGLLLTWLLVAGLTCWVTRRGFVGGLLCGLCLAMAAVIKLLPLLPGLVLLAVALRMTRMRSWLGLLSGLLAGITAGLLLIPAGLIGWEDNIAYLQYWWQDVVLSPYIAESRGFNLNSRRNQSLENAVRLLIDSLSGKSQLDNQARTFSPIWLGIRIALLCLLGGVAWRLSRPVLNRRRGWVADERPSDRLGAAVVYSLAIASVLVLSPVTWGHYFVMLAPAMVLLPMWLMLRGRPRWAWLSALTPALLILVHYFALDSLAWYGVLGLGIALWWIASCVSLIVIGTRQERAVAA
jgi:hypothetical protein